MSSGQRAAVSVSSRPSRAGGGRVCGAAPAADALKQHGYVTQSPIAAGAFSTIIRAKQPSSGREVAVKTFMTRARAGKAAADMKDVRQEVDALTRLQPSAHTHIANLLETFEGEYELHAILEYCGGGSVSKFLQAQGHGIGLGERVAASLTAQVGCALAHMHGLSVTHRDIKPDNLIFSDRTHSTVRLVDFGFAALCDGSRRLKTVCGSPAYMAPEIIRHMPYLGPPVDVWALGALLFELLHNKIAFRGETMAQLHARIRKGAHSPFAPETSAKAKGIVKKALTVDVEQRAAASVIARSLIDAFKVRVEAFQG